MANLTGKVVLVTGAASGIGMASAKAILAAGASVVFCDRAEDRLIQATRGLGDKAFALVADLTKLSDLDGLLTRTLDRFGQLDVLHANAGMYVGGEVLTGDPDAWDSNA